MDLTALSQEAFEQHRRDVLIEDERRRKIAGIPDQITALRGEYIAAGGDPADIT